MDPLDGTKEFLQRNGEFTVNIALIEDGDPVLGVIYAPALDLLYYAGRGLGAWKREGAGAPQRIHRLRPGAGQCAHRGGEPLPPFGRAGGPTSRP